MILTGVLPLLSAELQVSSPCGSSLAMGRNTLSPGQPRWAVPLPGASTVSPGGPGDLLLCWQNSNRAAQTTVVTPFVVEQCVGVIDTSENVIVLE